MNPKGRQDEADKACRQAQHTNPRLHFILQQIPDCHFQIMCYHILFLSLLHYPFNPYVYSRLITSAGLIRAIFRILTYTVTTVKRTTTKKIEL